MYPILIIASLYILFTISDWIIDEIYKSRIRRNILSNPLLRYEYCKGSYSPRKIKKLKQMPNSEYLHTKHWKLVSSAVWTRDRARCADCGVTKYEKPLEVHHITYIRKGKENLEDLMTLCGDCHQERHFISTIYE